MIVLKKKILLNLGYEYFEERFYYFMNDGTNRIMFHEFFSRFEPSLYWPDLMPKGEDFITALDKNIALLKKYGDGFLSGKEKI